MAHSTREIALDAESQLDYSYDEVYLFTWNPKDKFFPDGDNYPLKWDTMLVRVIKHLNRCMSKFCIVPEVSDQGRLHVHGWFVISDKIKWNKSVRPKIQRHGFMKMNRLKHVNGFGYYKKDMNSLGGYLPGRITVITKWNLKEALSECLHRTWTNHKELIQYRKNILDYCTYETEDELASPDLHIFLNVD